MHTGWMGLAWSSMGWNMIHRNTGDDSRLLRRRTLRAQRNSCALGSLPSTRGHPERFPAPREQMMRYFDIHLHERRSGGWAGLRS